MGDIIFVAVVVALFSVALLLIRLCRRIIGSDEEAGGIPPGRATPDREPAAIVVLSADVDEDRKIAALDGGADDYITKPFSMPSARVS